MSFLDFKAKNLRADLTSGVVSALIDIPDDIALALLAGINPTYAFNDLMTGTPIGSLFGSSHFMSIGLTSAIALSIGRVLDKAGIDGNTDPSAIFTVTLLVGVYMFVAGLLRYGKLVGFVSNAVMTGFVMGASLLIIIGEGLGNLAGSFFQSMATGGSLSLSGISVSGGAGSRWGRNLLMLAGVRPGLLEEPQKAKVLDAIGGENVFKAHSGLGAAEATGI